MIVGNCGPRCVCKVRKDFLLEEETFDWRTEGELENCLVWMLCRGAKGKPSQTEGTS